MPSTFSPSLRLELIGTGEQAGLWGQTTNNNLGDLLEQAISGATTLNVTSGNITLTALNGVVDEARSAVLQVTGTPGTTRVLTIPNVKKTYTVFNASDSVAQIKTATGVSFDCPVGSMCSIYCDGNNVIQGKSLAQTNSPAFTGIPTAPTAAYGTNTTQIATTAFVQASVPSGVIVMWSGSIASIPAGWALCNGSNGTPDLRDRFVVGAGSTYAVGATGGANTVTLTTANLPSHTHSISGSGTTSGQSAGHTHGFSAVTSLAGDHAHSFGVQVMWQADGSGPFFVSNGVYQYGLISQTQNAGNHTHSVSGTTGSTNSDHTHTFSFSGTSGATGSATAVDIRPPYYALAYIQKL